MKKIKIGFIGQGWIGKNYANDFENRGFETVRYSLEEPYVKNKDLIKDCDFVFIAVPTPSTPNGFDVSIVEDALKLIGAGKVAILKSTIVPGTTKSLQKKHTKIKVFYSPEFLSEATAKYDVENPFSNIIGIPEDTVDNKNIAEEIISILPSSKFTLVCSTTEAEMIKYSHNINGYIQIVFANIMYDLSAKLGADWNTIKRAITADPWMSDKYMNPVHKSGRGAGGACFIKDMAALRELYSAQFPNDKNGIKVLESLESKNVDLLVNSNKDLNLLKGVYGKKIIDKANSYLFNFSTVRNIFKSI